MDGDRLSELPDSLILSILSLLDMRDVVMTTLLSKRWKNRWTTVPCLDFWSRYPLNESPKFISGALAQWKGAKISELAIFFTSDDPLIPSCVIDSWLLFAIEKQVEKLTFGFLIKKHGAYIVPQCLYSCSLITELNLRSCSLKIETNVQWNQLKSLTLKCLHGLSGDAMNQILLGAPRLEKLVFLCLRISENFNIRSTSLKILKMFLCIVKAEGELRIWGPNLLKLKISGRVCGGCLLYVPSLITATLASEDYFINRVDMSREKMLHQLFRSIRYVENVSLPDWSIQFLVDMKRNDMLVQFPNAEFVKLHISDCQMLDVLDMFPKLKKLIVHKDSCMPVKLASEMISRSPSLLHLKTIEIIYESYPSISSLVKFLLENAHVLQKMVLQQFCEEYSEEAFSLASKELREMWRSSPYAEVIISPLSPT